MLAFIVFIITLLCLALSYRYSKNIFAPAVYTNLIWMVCILVFLVVPNSLPSLTLRFCGCLTLWILGLTIFSLLTQRVKLKVDENPVEASKLVRDIYLIISICSSYILFDFYKDVLTYGLYDNIFINLRLAAVGKLPPYFTEPFSQKYGGVASLIWGVCYTLEILYFKRKTWYRFFIIFLIVFIHGFITVSKSVFVDFFILSLVVLYLKKKVKLKTLIIVGGCLVALLLSIQTLRHGGNFFNIEERYGFITLYLSSSMSAFDVVEPMSSEHIGENTFRILYYIAEKLGISSIEPINPILPFIKEPIVTNTYTIMYPFYRDFGAIAVFIFSCIYGLFFGYIYNKMEVNNRSNWYLILYVTFFTYLFYQYSSECILTNLYPTLVRLVLLYLPFWCAKYSTIKKGKCYT